MRGDVRSPVTIRRSSSFAWANLLLPKHQRLDVAQLYGFCRAVDDIADRGVDPDAARARLARIRRELTGQEPARDPLVGSVLALIERRSIDLGPVLRLLDSLSEDAGPRRIADHDDLVRFAYGVAGTVGELMCDLLGAPSCARPFGIDLGIAMQLSNIARDVVEDARRDRIYLPADRLPAGVDPASLAQGVPEARHAAFAATRDVLRRAAKHYRSADRGIGLLPRRSRLGVAMAARLYESIGARVARLGPERCWRRRPGLAPPQVALAVLRAWVRRPSVHAAPRHDRALHTPLVGLLEA